MNCLVFDIFKAGPGPSSSHTIGPMRAALDFIDEASRLPSETLAGATALKAELYGSLADTGVGHGTIKALLAGLSGLRPETCVSGALAALPDEVEVRAGALKLKAKVSDVLLKPGPNSHPFSNTMRFVLLNAEGAEIFSRKAYSVGGGFVKRDGEAEAKAFALPAPFKDMRELRWRCAASGLRISEIVANNEMAASGLSREALDAKLDFILDAMDEAVERGLKSSGFLPGPLRLERKAATVFAAAEKMNDDCGGRWMALLDAYAFAASEENAAGGRVVTAPTSGSSGVIPSVARLLQHHRGVSRSLVREGLLAAAAIGGIARANASISGAEVGCQGEIGVASAMAAAMAAQALGASPAAIENAAETALEHHLGLTCDPVGGYVQIPCIERNAVAAVHAWNACVIAFSTDAGSHRVSFDEALEAMRQTGRDMSDKYKESARGGLAICASRC